MLKLKTVEQQAAVHQHEENGRGDKRGVRESVQEHADQPPRKILPT